VPRRHHPLHRQTHAHRHRRDPPLH
jgi:hypothetical protein